MNFLTKGIYLALATAFISGCSNFIMKFAVTDLKNPYLFTTIKNVSVALILALIVLSPYVFKKLKDISKKDWIKLVLIGIIGGSIPFLLFFKGLSMTSALSAAFIHKTFFVWVAILAVPFLKEKVSKIQLGALAILIIANYFFMGLKGFQFGLAEFLCLAATIMWAIENVIAKTVLKNVDAKVVAWARMFFGSIVLIGFIFLTGNHHALLGLNVVNWAWIGISALMLLGYVLTWYSAIKHESLVMAASVLVLASPITGLLSAIFITGSLALDKILAISVMALAIVLIYRNKPQGGLIAKKVYVGDTTN